MTAGTQRLTPDEIADRGQALYERHLRDLVQKTHFGQYLVIDVSTGEYEVGPDHLETAKRARAKRPEASLYGLKIGYPATVAIGGTYGLHRRAYDREGTGVKEDQARDNRSIPERADHRPSDAYK